MRAFLVLAVTLVLCAPAAAGSGDASSRCLARLGTPAEPEAVAMLVAEARESAPADAVALADALGSAGGAAALDGLVALLEHRDAQVRITALGALATVGLRSEPAAARLRRIIQEAADGEVVPAVEALGHVGDGRDMDVLLRLVRDGEARTRRAAYRAMAKLTGANVPYVQVRWAYYWKGFRLRATLLLPQALVALGMEADAPDTPALLHLVGRYGWVDLPTVRDHLARWIVEPDTELRIAACGLVRELRIADLAPEVESALHFAGSGRLREEIVRTLEVLGVPQPQPEDLDAE